MAIRKTCSNPGCKSPNPQPLANFSKDKTKRDGLFCRCKQCKTQEYQDNKEDIRAKQNQYNQEHREENKARDKRYYEKNKKRILARNKQYQQDHKQEIAICNKKYAQTEVGKVIFKKASRKYNKTEAGKASRKKRGQIRRAHLACVEYDNFDSKEVLKRDGYKCQLCRKKTRPDFKNVYHPLYPNLDHIIPITEGGSHTKLNTQCLCHSCNARKKNIGKGDQLRMFG